MTEVATPSGREPQQAAPGTPSAPADGTSDADLAVWNASPRPQSHLQTDASSGLTSQEAARRSAEYGPNEIQEHQVSPLLKLLSYFWGPIPWMIEVAMILSAAIGRWEDFFIILSLLSLNGAVGFFQERKADHAVAALKKRLALKGRVYRNGGWQVVPARDLVPGDFVRIRAGEIVPADVNLMGEGSLRIDESALTGESFPVEKRSGHVAYSGSVVRRGEMNGEVSATGMDTYFGKTTRLVQEAETESHFQKAVVKIGDYLIALAFALVVVIFMVALYREESLAATLQFALVLTVAAIPAALPTVLSVTMVVGATVLARKKAIVSRLAAIEEMAGVDVLCSDKTGTITKNELMVSEVRPLPGVAEDEVLLFALLASRRENQDPIDNAIIAEALKRTAVQTGGNGYRVKKFTPFDPVRKRTEALVEGPEGRTFRVIKGAPQVVLEAAVSRLATGGKEEEAAEIRKLPPGLRRDVDREVEVLAESGYRALGVAREESDGSFRFLGLLALFDPPREDSADTLQRALDLGVNVKMITGDHAAIAREVSEQVHLGGHIQEVSEFLDKPDREAERVVENADGFAQVFPEDKYHIVELLQRCGHIVGMTGDGVNDAPALKKADAGIAVAGATDAARSAADIVLTEPGLSVITDAITESRRVFARMNSYAVYRITETVRILFFITVSILAFNFYPVTAIMIVLLALLNDGPIMAIAYDRAGYSNGPVRWDMRTVLGISTFLGLVGVISSFGLFYLGRDVYHLPAGQIQSLLFLKLAVAGHLTIFLTRTRGPFWSSRPSAALLLSAVGTKALATLVVVYGWFVTPLGWKTAAYVWLYALAAFVITDLVKVPFYRLLNHGTVRFSR